MERFSEAKEAARKSVEEKKRKTEETEVEDKPVPTATVDGGKRAESVVMNGESKKNARTLEVEQTVTETLGRANSITSSVAYSCD